MTRDKRVMPLTTVVDRTSSLLILPCKRYKRIKAKHTSLTAAGKISIIARLEFLPNDGFYVIWLIDTLFGVSGSGQYCICKKTCTSG
jgi:hypothetical protein